MLFERIITPGLSHYSYILGDATEAIVIDPRRDCTVYVDLASLNEMRISTILETHRNEDLVTGSVELQQLTGAEIWHADSQWDYQYGNPVSDGQMFMVGKIKIESILTPGHTPGMMNYLVYDDRGAPWILFTGDTLLAGDVGRIDLMGNDQTGAMAAEIYESIYSKLLLLGDQVIICPAHGSGSVCAEDISKRSWTTIGLERLHNPKLQYVNKASFVSAIAHPQERPPYFKVMEKVNLEKSHTLRTQPLALNAQEFSERSSNAFVLDTRSFTDFLSAHIPNALSIWAEGLSSYAGWFIPYDLDLFIIVNHCQLHEVTNSLSAIGFDCTGYLSGDMVSWFKAGLETETVQSISVQKFCALVEEGDNPWILDVRSDHELQSQGPIPDAHHIPLTRLLSNLDEIPSDIPVHILCGSGARSTIASSLLLQQGTYNPVIVLGGAAALKSTKCFL